MIKHLFSLIWHKRKRYAGLIAELFISFLVLFVLISYSGRKLIHLLTTPTWQTGGKWLVQIRTQSKNVDSAAFYAARLQERFKAEKTVKQVSSGLHVFPYTPNAQAELVSYKKKKVRSLLMQSDRHFQELFEMPFAQGTGFTPKNLSAASPPVIINRMLAQALFPGKKATGKEIALKGRRYTICGVLAHFQKRPLKEEYYTAIVPLQASAHGHQSLEFAVQVVQGAGRDTPARLEEALWSVIAHSDWKKVRIESFSALQQNYRNEKLGEIGIGSLLVIFLLLNVLLALLGLVWYSIQRRRREIGLRRALGASRKGIVMHFMGETAVLATLALIPGLIVVGNLPVFNLQLRDEALFFPALAGAMLGLYALVFLAAWLPSRIAGKMQPAKALREQ